MLNNLLALPGNAWDAWMHHGHYAQPAPVSIDGACATCDYPFAHLSHACLGSGDRIAS